jgi:hypothetical protein
MSHVFRRMEVIMLSLRHIRPDSQDDEFCRGMPCMTLRHSIDSHEALLRRPVGLAGRGAILQSKVIRDFAPGETGEIR